MKWKIATRAIATASLATASLATVTLPTAYAADSDIHIGVLIGFTGPLESLAPSVASGAELALREASESGRLLGGRRLVPVRGDSTCTDTALATAAAERLVTGVKVAAIMGAGCSGATTAVLSNVAVPNGVVMVSPGATSPALTTIDDKGYFFRTVPSDARQGEVLATIVADKGIKDVAITYTNNDYGKGLSESFSAAFISSGGEVVISASHEDGKGDYSAEVGALAAAGSKNLMIFGYVDQGGRGIMQTAIDLDAFDNFFGGDGMVGDSLIENIGNETEGLVTTLPGGAGSGTLLFHDFASASGIDGTAPFSAEAYDSAALIALAIQAAGSDDREAIKDSVMSVANAPGEKILSGQLGKALQILEAGGEIDYSGATDVEFSEVGETNGAYKEQEVVDGKYVVVKIH